VEKRGNFTGNNKGTQTVDPMFVPAVANRTNAQVERVSLWAGPTDYAGK